MILNEAYISLRQFMWVLLQQYITSGQLIWSTAQDSCFVSDAVCIHPKGRPLPGAGVVAVIIYIQKIHVS